MMSKCLARRLTTLECFVCVAQLSFCFISLCVDIGFFFSFSRSLPSDVPVPTGSTESTGGYSTAISAFYYIFFSYRSLSFCRFDYSRFGNLPIWLIRNILHILTYVYWFVGIISISDDDEASNQHSLTWKHHFSCRICVCVCERKQKYNTDAAAAANPGMTWWRKSLVGRSPWVWGYYLMKGKEMKLFVVWKIFFLWFVVLVVVCWCNYSVKTRQLSLSLSLSLSLGIRLENKIKEPK